MRIAVIGVGHIGRIHAANLRDLPEVEEVVLADAVPGVERPVACDLSRRRGAPVRLQEIPDTR